jgi:hypothetical protein
VAKMKTENSAASCVKFCQEAGRNLPALILQTAILFLIFSSRTSSVFYISIKNTDVSELLYVGFNIFFSFRPGVLVCTVK